ncbi:hypothetical protein EDD70_0617 [Hydrogenoanaerobacterium saccharovorans]|uniref:Amidohydrolase 3 domain-containing protein n=1 Tax=Hydrogenoanaerobacterium saccharovorans TaxID=474960 RepID=A0A1H8AS83_9FIRM|nr:amidohydrolase family protein [Hydrogenoanaerobacterium saccharovorans]RPF47817.1 hypothetical protein EDD70_0617 [Hydrogenoanaerobacterium saccharovorans]SEM72669.1 hypothetical protein SAMN05216180_1474 [Hydrogenoanaerobacterium saccharovorans]
MSDFAEILLQSKAVFTAASSQPFEGFVAVSNGKILAVGTGLGEKYLGAKTKVYSLGDRLICPGFSDVHCFFTGYLLGRSGADLSGAKTQQQVLEMAAAYSKSLTGEHTVLCREVSPEIPAADTAAMDAAFGDVPAILFLQGGESCWMNTAAIKTYDFTPDTCWPESCWKLLRYILQDYKHSVPEFKRYLAMLNSRGITSIKEMGFDDFYGFTDALEQLEQSDELTMRVHFMSQPVSAPMNLEYGKAMANRFKGEFVRFSGYNQMTDGSISQYEGEMKQPYEGTDFCCKKAIDWKGLERDTLAADAAGFRFSLHAQGDGAIAKVLDIYEKCARGADGKVLLRHAMTDLECSDPTDLERMGRLGIVAEVYPQIMSIAHRASKIAMINEKIGGERGKNYWNRRKMQDNDVVLCCGTDLPLMIDDIPESVYHAVGGLFPEGGDPFNKENTLTVAELLTAWTRGGQYDLSRETELGTLESGKSADISVLDKNLFVEPIETIRDVKVCLTLVNGKIVYSTL